MKVHKGIPKLTINEDDANLVIEKVHECTVEAWCDAEKQREEIVKKLV